MGISAELLARLADSGQYSRNISGIGQAVISAVQARREREKRDFQAEKQMLELNKLRREEERALKLQNILTSSVTDTGFDRDQAATRLEVGGYLKEAETLRGAYSKATKSALEINKLIQDVGQEQVKSMADQQQILSARFGGLVSLTDEELPKSYSAALQDTQDLFPAQLGEIARQAETPQQMRQVAEQIWRAGGTFASQARFELDKEKLRQADDGEKQLGSDKYATQILQRMVDNRKNGRIPEFGMTPEEIMAVDKTFGKDRVNAAYQILSSRPDFLLQLQKAPTETARAVADAALTLREYERTQLEKRVRLKQEQDTPTTSAPQKPLPHKEVLSADEMRELKQAGVTPEKLLLFRKKYNKTPRQVYQDVMSRKAR